MEGAFQRNRRGKWLYEYVKYVRGTRAACVRVRAVSF